MQDFEIDIDITMQTKYNTRSEQYPIMKLLLQHLRKSKLKEFKMDAGSDSNIGQITLDKKDNHVHVITRQRGYNVMAHTETFDKKVLNEILYLVDLIMKFFSKPNLLKIKEIEFSCDLMAEEPYSLHNIINGDAVSELSKQKKIKLEPIGTLFSAKIDSWDAIIMATSFSKELAKKLEFEKKKNISVIGYMLSKTVQSYKKELLKELHPFVQKLDGKTKKGK